MVEKKMEVNGVDYFKCSICGFFYKEEQLAQRCEDWCKKHKSCNLEITEHAVKLN
ncbi:MAG: hypothetical protein AABW64_01080 [Nanoarchaeota archaeon]